MGLHRPHLNVIFVCFAILALSGCVQRRLIVRSNPEGAFVSIDNQSIGYTPLSVPYTYSGTRDIKLEKDGFKTIKVAERVRPRWFDTFPVSLVTNNFWPRELRDERVLDFQMEPKNQPNELLLRERAEDLRQNVNRGTVTAPIR